MNFRAFEEKQGKARKKVLKLRREQCTKWLYKSLRHDSAQPLDTLVKEEAGYILDVDPMDNFVQVVSSMTIRNADYHIGGAKATILDVRIDVEEPEVRYWALFDTDRLLVPGLEIVKRYTLSEVPEIHDELQKLWISRWQQLAQVPANAWDRILAFTRASVPPQMLKYQALTACNLSNALASGNGLKTRGPDAWSKDDLKALPSVFMTDVANLFNKVECGMDWPQQLVRGHVTALAKRVDAEQVHDYRPVTLYSLLYRLWGSCRSRDLLAQLSCWSHEFHIFGYLRGRGCEDLTYFVQTSLEMAKMENGSLSGVLLDIKQCFNFIPRVPLWYLARRFGVPLPVITAWQSFLRLMVRAFSVRGQLSTALVSDTGLPEGDAMSCLGMVLMNLSFHHYLRHFVGQVTVMTFVDNFELMHVDSAQVHRAYLVSQTWLEIMGLKEDAKKTSFWSLDAADRATFRAHGLQVIEHGGDLGASMQYCKGHRNRFLQERIQKALPLFDELRKLSAAKWYKLLALKTSLFPRALHAVSNVFLEKQWLTKLRTLSMRALGDNRAGASPLARLAFVYPVQTDPAFFELHRTFTSFLRLILASAELRHRWVGYVAHHGQQSTYGPFAKLQKFCDELGWSIDVDLNLHLHSGVQLSLLHMDKHRLTELLRARWHTLLAMQIAVRKDYAGLVGVDYEATFFALSAPTQQQSALLDCIRDGTSFVRAFKSKFDASITGLCLYCSEEDTLEHRALQCPFYTEQRLRHPSCVRDWHRVPIALSHHGWSSSSSAVSDLQCALESLPKRTVQWESGPVGLGVQNVFTDGSCLHPTSVTVSLSSWAAVHADASMVLGAGVLPSLWQSIDRAELWAIVQVLYWALDFEVSCCIWTDSAYAMRGMLFVIENLYVPDHWKNQDIWQIALQLVVQLPGMIGLRKVAAHRDPEKATSAEDSWQIRWNGVADAAAKRVLAMGLPDIIRRPYDLLMREHLQHRRDSARFQRFLLELAERSLQSTERPEHEPTEDFLFDFEGATENNDFYTDVVPVGFAAVLSASPFLQQFGVQHARSLMSFLFQLEANADFVIPVTYLELLLAFVKTSDAILPVQVSEAGATVWRDLTTIRAGDLYGVTLASQLRTFQMLVVEVFGCLGVEIDAGFQNRPECGLLKRLPSLRVPWPQEVAILTHSVLASYTRRRPIRNCADLARPLP